MSTPWVHDLDTFCRISLTGVTDAILWRHNFPDVLQHLDPCGDATDSQTSFNTCPVSCYAPQCITMLTISRQWSPITSQYQTSSSLSPNFLAPLALDAPKIDTEAPSQNGR